LSDEADIFAPVRQPAAPRSVVGNQLTTALSAAWVIGLFQATLEQLRLAPRRVDADRGWVRGIAGSQTLTLMIRGLALGSGAERHIRIPFSTVRLHSTLNGACRQSRPTGCAGGSATGEQARRWAALA
jgi:magnesium transporter